MKTKAQIVQELLNDGKITAEEAVTLLMGDSKEKEYIFIPQNPYTYPYNPVNPYGPFWISAPTFFGDFGSTEVTLRTAIA